MNRFRFCITVLLTMLWLRPHAIAADRTRLQKDVRASAREDRLHDKHHGAAIKAARHNPEPEDVGLSGDLEVED